MRALETKVCTCPYCGESNELIIDCSQQEQNYIEDCCVCCKPMTIIITIHMDETIDLQLLSENDSMG